MLLHSAQIFVYASHVTCVCTRARLRCGACVRVHMCAYVASTMNANANVNVFLYRPCPLDCLCLVHLHAPTVCYGNLRTKILVFRGYDSSILLNLGGGIRVSIGNCPEMLGQRILVRIILVRLGVSACLPAHRDRPPRATGEGQHDAHEREHHVHRA